MMNESARVLIVEDDEDDLFLTQRALRKVTTVRLFHVDSGRGAIDFLAGRGPFADRAQFPPPHVVLLDLKMNDMNGHEVLEWVRIHLRDAAPRIFVLTGSNEPRDRELVGRSGVSAGYLVKPLSAEHLHAVFGPTAA